MKKYNLMVWITLFVISFTTISCGDEFLTSSTTEQQEAGGVATEGAILSNLGSAYQILLHDSYANNEYNSVLFMSDLRSDDVYKGGGDAGDQGQLYKLSQFSSTSAETISGLWTIYYTGLARCNNVLIACDNAINVSDAKLNQYKAEAHFLRAYYVHLLWKFWGDIPYFEEPLDTAPYMVNQLPADEVYAKIMADLDFACSDDKLSMNTSGANLGRVSKAAALMLKARVVLYQKDETRYAEITNDMATIITSNAFTLFPSFSDMWLDANEFCSESIFESNQLPEGKTWASGWGGYGTNLPAFISPNSLAGGSETGDFKGGWGFGPVRQAAYDMYEDGDTRREGSINQFDSDDYAPRFQDTGLFQAKYAARVGYNPQGDVDLNYCNNLRIFRYAETLLNYAELVSLHGQAEVQGVSAQNCLDLIRKRAFGTDQSIPLTATTIKLERRREFLGEGMRFWDLVRWGDATTVLTENDAIHNSTRTFEEWMKYIPIPQSEIDKTKGTEFELKQTGQWN